MNQEQSSVRVNQPQEKSLNTNQSVEAVPKLTAREILEYKPIG